MPRFPDHLTFVSDILATSSTDGEVRCNVGDQVTGTGVGAEVPIWGVDGFVSRPNDPSEAGAAMGIYIVDGDQKRIIASRDNRFTNQAGALQPGDRAIVSDCDASVLLKKATNSVTLYTTNETDDDKAMIIDLGGQAGIIQILNSGAFIQIEKDKITLAVNGGGGIVIDSTGVQTTGPSFVAKSSSVVLGVSVVVPGVNSALYGVTGIMGVASTSVLISP